MAFYRGILGRGRTRCQPNPKRLGKVIKSRAGPEHLGLRRLPALAEKVAQFLGVVGERRGRKTFEEGPTIGFCEDSFVEQSQDSPVGPAADKASQALFEQN